MPQVFLPSLFSRSQFFSIRFLKPTYGNYAQFIKHGVLLSQPPALSCCCTHYLCRMRQKRGSSPNSTSSQIPSPPTPSSHLAPPTIPLGTFGPTFNLSEPGGGSKNIVCFPAFSSGVVTTPAEALAVVDLYKQTICSAATILTAGRQTGIVLAISGSRLVLRNRLPILATPPPCEESVEDFVQLVDLCWNGRPTFGGLLLELGVFDYIIASATRSCI